MAAAKPQAEKHTRAGAVIAQLPQVPQDQQCTAIKREQIGYIELRKQLDNIHMLGVEGG